MLNVHQGSVLISNIICHYSYRCNINPECGPLLRSASRTFLRCTPFRLTRAQLHRACATRSAVSGKSLRHPQLGKTKSWARAPI